MRVNESAMLRAAVAMASVWFAGSLASCASSEGGEMKVPLSFSGGHEIGKKDFGRPVVLIAAALEVKPEVFREAFSGVTPARGRGPSREEAKKNKAALMKVLAPHKVTNERLDEVSNYYRFRPEKKELWPTTPAKGYAVVEEGKIKSITMTSPGSGYCSPPKVTVKGVSGVEFEVTLSFSKDLKKNGGVESCVVKE